jgi:hypothetical protein
MISVTSIESWDIIKKIVRNVGNSSKRKGKCLITGIVSVYFESNLTEVSSNTWWLDSAATTHVSNTMQGFLSI